MWLAYADLIYEHPIGPSIALVFLLESPPPKHLERFAVGRYLITVAAYI